MAGKCTGTDPEGKATISTAICTRDDIMIYLIKKEWKVALHLRSWSVSVREKEIVKEWTEWEERHENTMYRTGISGPVNKIKYMFPKAHAAAYVMMAYRIA